MKLGSEFLREFNEGGEKPLFFNITKRDLIFYTGVVVTVALELPIIFFNSSDLLLYTLALILIPPLVLYKSGYDQKLKERLRYLFTVQNRAYLTEFDTEKEINSGFIQKEGFSEAHSFRKTES